MTPWKEAGVCVLVVVVAADDAATAATAAVPATLAVPRAAGRLSLRYMCAHARTRAPTRTRT